VSTDPITQRIADAAARLLARDEAATLDSARRKAAARLGLKSPSQLPDDRLILDALGAYRALFCAPEPPAAPRWQAALEAMRFMADFRPELTETPSGPCLPQQALSVLLYCEDPDAPLHRLLEAGLRHRIRRDALYRGDAGRVVVDVLRVDRDHLPVEFWPLPPSLRGVALGVSPHGEPLPRISLRRAEGLAGAR
jgi:hypothetical protein